MVTQDFKSDLPLIYFIVTWALSTLLEYMRKKFEINQTKIKGSCQSGRKVVTHNSKSDLPLVCFKMQWEKWMDKTTSLDLQARSCPNTLFLEFTMSVTSLKQKRRFFSLLFNHVVMPCMHCWVRYVNGWQKNWERSRVTKLSSSPQVFEYCT